jgi:hypothetical protein
MNGDERGGHSSDPAEGSREQGEEAEERVRRQQEEPSSEESGPGRE